MRSRSLLLMASAFVGTVMLSSAAMATPVVIDGISLPAYTDGTLGMGLSDHETEVKKVGDVLNGTGIVTSIAGGAVQTYGSACAVTSTGCSLAFNNGSTPTFTITDVFQGFKVSSTSYDSVTNKTTIDFTGGTLDFYIKPNVPQTTTTNLATSIANAESSTLFLALKPELLDAAGTTFTVTLVGNSFTTFPIAKGTAFLDVVGGDAASYFNTNSVANAYLSQMADLGFGGNAAPLLKAAKAFLVGGNDSLFNNESVSVPEPLTLSLFGAGLVGVAGIRRKKKTKKS